MATATSDEQQIGALIATFFRVVSFPAGERPAYDRLRMLFSPRAVLVDTSGPEPVITTLDEFIRPREARVRSEQLAQFEEIELMGRTVRFGNVAHRFSTYAKSGVSDGEAFGALGMISAQFIRAPEGWLISAMAWDDERPGLSLPES